MDHPILALAHGVRALGLPVCDPLETSLAGLPQRIRIDKALGIVGDLFTGVAQVLHVRLGGRSIWRTGGQGILVSGKLKTDQVASWRGS